MNVPPTSPEARYRQWLDGLGGTADLQFASVLATWNIQHPTPEDGPRIEAALRQAGVVVQPSLSGLSPQSPVRLAVAQVPGLTAPYAVPPRPAPASGQTSKPTTAALVGLCLGIAGAVLALIATLLPWISGLSESVSYWKLFKAQDILLTLLAVATVGVTVPLFFLGHVRALRLVVIGVTAGLLSFVLITPFEFIAFGEEDVSTFKAGEVVALLAAAALLGALVMQVSALRPLQGSDRGSILVVGLAMLTFVGLVDPLVALLPIESGVSAWESAKVADILSTIIDLAMAALALAAILIPGRPLLPAVVFALGSYTAVGVFVAAVEGLAAEANGIAVFVNLLLIAPLAAAAAVLVAVGSRPRPSAGA